MWVRFCKPFVVMTPQTTAPSGEKNGALAKMKPLMPSARKPTPTTTPRTRFGEETMVLVRARLKAELFAGPVVQHDDLATDLGALGDLSRPGHDNLALLVADRVDPRAAVAVEGRHGRRRGVRVGESTSDEKAVVGVVVIHVVKHGRHDIV
jgi:hypothetical protein